jgi:hypothetical protein
MEGISAEIKMERLSVLFSSMNKCEKNRPKKQTKIKGPPICKMCGKPFAPNSDVKPVRRKEYCTDCDCKRASDRQKRASGEKVNNDIEF